MRPAPTLLGAAVLVLVAVPAPWAGAEPVPPTSADAPVAHASPHEAAYRTLIGLKVDDRFPEVAGASHHFVRDQMIAILVLLYRAELHPQAAIEHVAAALRTWDASEGAYQASGDFYDVTLETRSLCIHAETNAWALMAADRLAAATGAPDLATRATELGQTMTGVVTGGQANGVPGCPPGSDIPAAQWPVPLLALFLHAEATGSASARQAAIQRLKSQIEAGFEQGFQDPSGLYLAQTNAQYLVVFQTASVDEFGDEQASLSAFIQEHMLVPDDDALAVFTVAAEGPAFATVGSPEPAAQLWAAMALHQERAAGSLTVPSAPELLLNRLFQTAWSTVTGGFVTATGTPPAELNGLAALFTLGPIVTDFHDEGARVEVFVPALSSFTFPAPTNAGADSYYIANEWNFRFTLERHGPQPQRVLLPLRAFGPLSAPEMGGGGAGPPRLFHQGVQMETELWEGRHPVMGFLSAASSSATYQLSASAPVVPTQSTVRRDLQVFLGANTSQPLTLDVLRLEVGIREVELNELRLNGAALEPGQYEWTDVESTAALGQPHLRIALRGVTLRHDGPNEVQATYSDLLRPSVGNVVVAGSSPTGPPLPFNDGRYRISRGDTAYLRVPVTDNAAIRSVTASWRIGIDAWDVTLTPTGIGPGTFAAPLPDLPLNERIEIEVRALDEHGNLGDIRHVVVETQPPFFREGSLVLLVFSAVLFVVAVVIYLKMLRRRTD